MGDTETTDELPLGRAVKFVGLDTIEGLAMPFGLDTDGETFTKSTDLCADWYGPAGRPLLYKHGLDSAMKTEKIGTQTEYEVRDEGIWAQSQLDLNAHYRKAIDKLVERGALGYSAGAMGHLATKSKSGEITRFPWVELSLTPTPANPRALGVHFIKSADFLERFEADGIPAPLKAALAALDEWSDIRDVALVSEPLADRLDRVSVELEGLKTHAQEYAAMRLKSGRVLSQTTRERLTRHPASLRELADDLDGLLKDADAEKAAKSADFLSLVLETERITSRLLGVDLPGVTTP